MLMLVPLWFPSVGALEGVSDGVGVALSLGVGVPVSVGAGDAVSVGVADADSEGDGVLFAASAASQLASSARVSSAVFLHRRMYSIP